MKAIIIRGVPGTGKTTLAQQYAAAGFVHCEADQFFEVDGEYQFDPRKIRAAHEFCTKKFSEALAAGADVVVSNTFTQKWEYQPYLDRAVAAGYEVEVIVLTKEYGSIHGVPEEAMDKMRNRFEMT